MQSKDMHIDVVINHLRGLITYLKNYKENSFAFFSKLKLIKLYLRSTMLQNRLNELTILSIESERLELHDYKTLINNFAVQKTRKIT
uniref:Uncharacterized protein n=1 Tax=Cajanus cajan TaxID=3821 RepID=A0A151S5D7_CAJCA|nr:hypothetical protein KK1_028224 [Cajanus cajan]KYP49996.1 hypothetical protein KK1_028236 [Cajanus cajan]